MQTGLGASLGPRFWPGVASVVYFDVQPCFLDKPPPPGRQLAGCTTCSPHPWLPGVAAESIVDRITKSTDRGSRPAGARLGRRHDNPMAAGGTGRFPRSEAGSSSAARASIIITTASTFLALLFYCRGLGFSGYTHALLQHT